MLKLKISHNGTLLTEVDIRNPDAKTVDDLVKDCLSRYQILDQTRHYALYYTQKTGGIVRLENHSTFGELMRNPNVRLPQAAQLQVQQTGSFDGIQSVVPAVGHGMVPIGGAQSPNLMPQPVIVAVQPDQWRSALHCAIEVSKNKLIQVPLTGLSLDREFVREQLSTRERLQIKAREMMGQETPLDYISREKHCDIYLHTSTQQWHCRAYRSVVVNGQTYKGQELQLQPVTTEMRLGRAGIVIAVHLSGHA